MGKKRAREKRAVAPPGEGPPPEDGESDNESHMSDATHMSIDDDESICGDGVIVGEEDLDTDEALRRFESQLSENIENATHKNSSIRSGALKNLQALLSRYVLPEVLVKWQSSLCDLVERSVKKGTNSEASAAVRILALATVQLGVDIDTSKAIVLLRTNVTDESLCAIYRGLTCAPTLALCTYVAGDEVEMLTDSIAALRTMWSSIKAGNVVPELGDPFDSAVHSYGLLLSQLPRGHLADALKTDIPKLTAYLQSNQVQIRISAGETLALLYELACDNDREWRAPNHPIIIERLDQLQNDSLKYHAKRDRRVQRATFRDITQYIKTRQQSSVVYKFGVDEKLTLRSWTAKLCYDTHCTVLRSAMNAHLQKNTLLREIFDLGRPILTKARNDAFGEKSDRLAMHAAADKARKQHRGKQRAKRLASFSGEQ